MNVMNILQAPFFFFFFFLIAASHANWCLRKFSKEPIFGEFGGWRANSCTLLSSFGAVVRPVKSVQIVASMSLGVGQVAKVVACAVKDTSLHSGLLKTGDMEALWHF